MYLFYNYYNTNIFVVFLNYWPIITESGIISETNNTTTDYSVIARLLPLSLSYICVTMEVSILQLNLILY